MAVDEAKCPFVCKTKSPAEVAKVSSFFLEPKKHHLDSVTAQEEPPVLPPGSSLDGLCWFPAEPYCCLDTVSVCHGTNPSEQRLLSQKYAEANVPYFDSLLPALAADTVPVSAHTATATPESSATLISEGQDKDRTQQNLRRMRCHLHLLL